jgi:transcriptional regulator with XRE-family HTH domain
VRESTIHKHSRAGAGSHLATAIGAELRRRRVDAGLTQAVLGTPLTRGFVSAVEHGRAVPSIPALALLADRLGITLDEFFLGVHSEMTTTYNGGHEHHSNAPSRHRR